MNHTSLILALYIIIFTGCSSLGPSETNVNEHFSLKPQFQQFKQGKIAFYEQGTSMESVVFMHGIPTHSYLWRNVMGKIANDNKKAIAFDLPGYGWSDVPINGDYSYESLYSISAQWLDSRPEKKFTLVVTDLGSVIGLDWAMKNPHRISGIVMLEAAFMPAKLFYAEAPFTVRRMFSMMKNERFAKFMMVKKPRMQSMAIGMYTRRKLSKAEKQQYLAPYENLERRQVLLKGPGPATILDRENGLEGSGIAIAMNRNAVALKKTDLPILLLKAKPGLLVRDAAINYANENFENLTVKEIGAGLHFVPEDQPTAIADAINEWVNISDRIQQNKATSISR